AASALGAIGPDARQAVPALLDAYVTRMDYDAVDALGGIGPDAKAAVPVLLEGLKKVPPGPQARFILALKGIGPAAKEAVPTLLKIRAGQPAPGAASRLAAAMEANRRLAEEAIRAIDPQAAAKAGIR